MRFCLHEPIMTLSSWGAHFGSGFGKYQTWVPCLVLPFEKMLIKAFPENALLKSRKGRSLMYLLSGKILRGLRMMTLPPRGHSMSLPVYQALCKPSVYFAPFYSFPIGPGKQALNWEAGTLVYLITQRRNLGLWLSQGGRSPVHAWVLPKPILGISVSTTPKSPGSEFHCDACPRHTVL